MPDDLSPDDDDRLARRYRETDDDVEPPGEWSSLRAMIGAARETGFDEEPPARIDALLMAAARQHAPAPRPRWWQRLAAWMKPVMLHPATAGALALVVVVGVAGVMTRRGDRRVAQPPPPASDQSTAAAAADAPPTAPARGEVRDDVTAGTPAPSPAAPVVRRPGDRPAGATKRPPPVPQGPTGGGGASAGLGSTTTTQGPIDEAGDGEGAVADDDRPVGGPPPAPPPPPPAPPPPPIPTTRSGTTAANDRPAPSQDKGPVVERAPLAVAELFTQAQRAARAGDCVKVRAVSAQVLARDPAYHKSVFAKDAAIATCLPASIGY